MFESTTHLSRRGFLRSAGALVALPALESFEFKAFATASKEPVAPMRMAFLYIPNGVNQAAWAVKGEGKAYELSPFTAHAA